MTLLLVGLGPSPLLDDLTRRAERALRSADRVIVDTTTAAGGAARAEAIAALLDVPAEVVGPLDASAREAVLMAAQSARVALAVAGDPLVATPYRLLVQDARTRSVAIEIVPGVSMATAAASSVALDPSQMSVVEIQHPGHLSAAERSAIGSALDEPGGVILIGAGREEEITAAAWAALRAELEQAFTCAVAEVEIDGGGVTLVVSRAIC